MDIALRDISKRFGDVVAVRNLDLEVRSGEFVALLGPSGCGKTTTLLILAGIYSPSEGDLFFGGQRVNDLLPRERGIGMVFQSYALYSHMTVFRNIAYPLRLQRLPKDEIERKVTQIAKLLQIEPLLARKPGELSGGQQQRVALARALVKEPDLLLFDEPLSNLDARLRLTMRGELKRLQRELSITSIYVTHDQVEAMTMADRIAIMNDGILQAYGSPTELYDQPDNLFVAGFIGNPPMNLIEAKLQRGGPSDPGGFTLSRGELTIPVPEELGRQVLGALGSREVIFGIRPEHIYVDHASAAGDGSSLDAQIFVVEPLGREDLIDCQIGDARLHVLAPAPSHPQAWHMGDTLRLHFDTTRLHLFDPESGRSLLTEGRT